MPQPAAPAPRHHAGQAALTLGALGVVAIRTRPRLATILGVGLLGLAVLAAAALPSLLARRPLSLPIVHLVVGVALYLVSPAVLESTNAIDPPSVRLPATVVDPRTARKPTAGTLNSATSSSWARSRRP